MNFRKVLKRAGIVLLALILVVGITTAVVVRTDWFRNYVRQKIISATAESTGGRVEIESFSFSLSRLEAVVTNFVIHGKEPASAAPFVKAAKVQVNLRVFTSLRRFLDISYLGIEQPQVNVMVFADGTTNLPQPKETAKSDTTTLDTVVDLAVDRFLISNGLFMFNSRLQPLDVRANNLHALLRFNPVTRSYQGDISLQPIYVVHGRNTPVIFTVTLPLVLERTRIALENARIATPASDILISGSIADLKNPRTTARINGHVALADVRMLADVPLDATGKSPPVVSIDGNAAVDGDRITVSGLRLGIGGSLIEASGTLRDPQGSGSLRFKASLALDELGRMTKLDARPAGTFLANGKATLDARNNYSVTGEIEGRNLSFSQGALRFRNVALHSGVTLDPRRVDLKGLYLAALGGEFHGNVSLEDFARYSVEGGLRNFDIQTALTALGEKPLPYDASVSGAIDANGDLKSKGAKVAVANAKLTVAPGRSGIPVSGRLNARYNGESGNINVTDSYLALPNSRLNLNGSLNSRLNFDFTSRNLNDLLAAAGPNPPAIKLVGGIATFNGSVSGALSAPHVIGHLSVTQFSVEDRRFDALGADLDAAKNRVALNNGILQRVQMQAVFAASAGLDNWSPNANQALRATVNVRNGDLADVMALAGQSSSGYAGALSVDANIAGTLGNPTGSADLTASNGKIVDEPFDRIQAHVTLSDQLITIPAASARAGASQIILTAEFQHPRDSLSTGQLHTHVQSSQWNLAQLRTVQQQKPNTGGVLTLAADIRGSLSQRTAQGHYETEFLLTAVNADAAVRDLRLEGQPYCDATLNATTSGTTVRYGLTSNFAGSDVRVNGTTQLTKDYPTTADATLRNLPLERALVAAKSSDIPARGVLSGTAHFAGTIENPEGTADLELTKATVYDETIDRLRAQATYTAQRVEIPLLEVISGPSRINLSAQFDHQPHDFDRGNLEFNVTSTRIDLTRFRNLQKARPGLGGVLQIAASGSAKVQPGATRVLFQDLNADISATGVAAQGKTLGELSLNASTNAGRLNFTLASNLGDAAIHGAGSAQLSGDYPLDAPVGFP